MRIMPRNNPRRKTVVNASVRTIKTLAGKPAKTKAQKYHKKLAQNKMKDIKSTQGTFEKLLAASKQKK